MDARDISNEKRICDFTRCQELIEIKHKVHNLKSTLAVAYLNASMLTPSPQDEQRIAKLIKIIKKSSDAIDQIIHRDALQVQKVISLEKLVREEVDFFQKAFEFYNIDFEIHFQSGIKVIADETEMKQIFQNLFGNSLHALQSKENRKIIVHGVFVDSKVKIKVSDNGCGIDSENLKKIFTPYFTTKTDVDASGMKGTGLGLAFVNQTVTKNGGDIHVESQLDQGTTFILEWPRILNS